MPLKHRYREAKDFVSDIREMVHMAVAWGFHDARFINAASRAYVAMARGMARRLLRRHEGTERGELLVRRDALSTRLEDLDALARMPDGSLGRAYHRYLERYGIPPINTLLEAIEIEARATRYGWSDDERWLIRRVFEEHDLWHVICSYGASPVGEWHLNAFSYPSLGNKATFAFGFAAPLLGRPEAGWRACIRGLWAAYRRGAACDLFARDYSAMLESDLAWVRAEVGLAPFEDVHPHGLTELRQRAVVAAAS